MVTEAIKKGYKQTEVGVIPEDWDIKPLPEVCWFQEGPGLRNWQFTISGMKVINVTNLENGYLNLDRTDRHISLDEFNKMYKHFAIDDKDIVVASSGNSYAKVAVVRNQDLPLVMNTSVIRFKPLKNIDYNFLLIFLKSKKFKDQIDLLITGGAQPNFGPFHLKKIILAIPKEHYEQSAISSIISDTDTLIEQLETLIAKKKNIKQGAMQELLTGKRRLPGFKGEWEVKKLGDIAEFYNGKAHEQFIYDNGEYIVINSKFISTEGEVYKTSSINLFPLKEKDITMVMSDIPNGKALAKCFIVPKSDKYALNQRICAIRTNLVDYTFLYFILNRNEYYLAFDSGSGQTNLKKNNVLDCHLKLPPTKEEQSAIAQILSDMDLEIDELERKRDKYKDIKTGMMQELLTGRIRLNVTN